MQKHLCVSFERSRLNKMNAGLRADAQHKHQRECAEHRGDSCRMLFSSQKNAENTGSALFGNGVDSVHRRT